MTEDKKHRKIDYSKFGFLPYQVKWLEDKAQIKLYEKSRRIGMTFAQAFEDVEDAGVNGLYNVWFSSNNDTNAKEYIDYCKNYAEALNMVIKAYTKTFILKESKNDVTIYIIRFANGKKITALSSSPNQLHGKGGKIVLDEFARRDDELEVWKAASPAALVWGYPIRIISTHNGKKSLFYSFVQRLKKGTLKWRHYHTTFVEAVRQGLADKALHKHCTMEEQDAYIEGVKDATGDNSVWNEQYMLEAEDGDTILLPRPILETAGKAEMMTFEELKACKELYAGLDVGRFKNFSLFYVIEKVSASLFITRWLYAIQAEEFPKQDKKISAVLMDLPNLRRLCVDYTGMGIGLTEYLQEKFGTTRVEGVTLTANVKETLAFRMKKMLEDLSFLIPADQEIYDDFQLVKKVVTTAGNIRLPADTKNDSHADRFWGAALSLEAAIGDIYVAPEVHVAPMSNTRSARLDKILSGWNKDYR